MKQVLKESKKYRINTIISFIGIGISVLYSVCEASCTYLKGSIFSVDLKYMGIFYMGMLIVFNLLKKDLIFLSLLSLGLGAEIYLIGFQLKNSVYCYYCLAFGATVLTLFLLNFNRAKKTFIVLFLVLGIILFLIFFQGVVTPLYAEEIVLPSFGDGKIKVRIYTDYFCGPCGSLEPDIEKIIKNLVKDGVINVTFIDTPIHKHTSLYAKYFLFILKGKNEFNHAIHSRAALFEAARLKITEEEKLKEFLKKRKIEFSLFDVKPTLSLMNSFLKEDRVRATPTCVILNGERNSFTGVKDITEALNRLK